MAIFPVEIFGEISSFVAGENDFGTLASLCATSKLMARELKGFLYETVVINDGFLHRLRSSRDDEDDFQELRHVKYVVCLLPGTLSSDSL
jgi:hypothetical protein